MGTLVKKAIVDKNGVATTRMVNPDKGKPANNRAAGAPLSKTARVFEPRVELPEPNGIPLANHGIIVGDDGAESKRWMGEPLEHTSIDFEGYEWDLAPKGYSGGFCSKCKSFYTDEQIDKAAAKDDALVCEVCEDVHRGGAMHTGVRYDDRKFFDKTTVRETDWYHITVHSDWESAIVEKADLAEQPIVHIGTLDAAKRRMAHLEKEFRNHSAGATDQDTVPPTFYCYKVKIKPEAPISDYVIPDYDSMAPRKASDVDDSLVISDDYELYGVTRYVNEYEYQGSISLSAHPSSFEVVDRVTL